LWLGILIAFIPAAVVGVIFNKKIEQYLFSPVPIAISLLVGGIVMIVAEKHYKNNDRTLKPEDVTVKQGFIIGLFQCLSLWPGFSRSASTIIGGWVVGMTTAAAAEFTFFLAIPTMFAASGYSLIKSGITLSAGEVIMLIIGFVVAFLVALVVVKRFIEYLKHRPLKYFAYYRILIGIVILILAVAKVVKV
jgi:undecaprenyl-diphosphatase